MACSSRLGTACFLQFIEESHGERVTQREWHAIRILTEVEHGSRLTRARASHADTEAVVGHLESSTESAPAGSIERLRASVEADRPTEGTLRAMLYLSNHGVPKTLAKVRGNDPPSTQTQYAAAITADGRTYVQKYDSAAIMASALHELHVATYTVVATRDGTSVDIDSGEALSLVESGWREHQEQNKVIPDHIIYSTTVEFEGARYGHHSSKPAEIRQFIKQFPLGAIASVCEERKGSTLANPDRNTYENVELSTRELEAFLQEPDENQITPPLNPENTSH